MKISAGTLSFIEARDLEVAQTVLTRLSRASIPSSGPEWHVLRAAHVLVSEALLYADYPEQRERPEWLGE